MSAGDAASPPPLPLLLRLPLFAVRLTALLVLVLVGLFCIACCFPLLPLRARNAIGRAWARTLLLICGVTVRHRGAPALQGAGLWVANHVSWLDIFVLNHARQTVFVAKSELRRWPVLGWLIAGAGTVFVDRRQRHAVRDTSAAMQERFASGQVLGLFPEGTTSPGFDLLPFYASLLEPALRTGVPVQPVALLYTHHGRRSALAAYTGNQSLAGNLWCVLGATGVGVEAVFLKPVATAGVGWTRHSLAASVRQALAQVVTQSGSTQPACSAHEGRGLVAPARGSPANKS